MSAEKNENDESNGVKRAHDEKNGDQEEPKKQKLDDEASNDGQVLEKKQKLDFGEAGTLLFSGATDWKEIGRKSTTLPSSPNTIWSPHLIEALKDVKLRFVSSSPVSASMLAIDENGRVWAWGRNEKGQLGLGDTKDRKVPSIIPDLDVHNIVAAAAGRGHSLFLTDKGQVYAAGDNRSGQTTGGKKATEQKTPVLVQYSGPPAKRIACGAEFSMLLDIDGGVWTWGHPQYGQLGNGTNGQNIAKAGKIDFYFVYHPQRVVMFVEKDPKGKLTEPVNNVEIREIACGANHCVAIDTQNRGYSWGFGGYGRLGHSDTKDELVPRLIKFFDAPKRGLLRVVCGAQFNLAITEWTGMVFMWGQYVTNKEANMYPKSVGDLCGWGIRHMACGAKGWMVAADDTVIGQSASPCYGELALGDLKKSSAAPVEITTLKKVHVLRTAMGLSQSLFLVRNQTEEDAKAIADFRVLKQKD